MNKWLGVALVAYLVGGIIEGVTAALQLSRSAPEMAQETHDSSSDSTNRRSPGWHLFAAIAAVSLCGAFSWPCRLIHRTLKGEPKSQSD